MWNKPSLWLYVRLSLRGVKPRLQLWLPLALFVGHQLLLAWEGGLSLLPGQAGVQARRTADAIHATLLELMAAPPLTIADVNVQDGAQRVRVLVRTCGFSVGGGEA